MRLLHVRGWRDAWVHRRHESSLGIYGLAFSCDAAQLASASSDTTVLVWDVSTGACRQQLRPEAGYVYAAHWLHDGLACGTSTGAVQLWDTRAAHQSSSHSVHSDAVYGRAACTNHVFTGAGLAGERELWSGGADCKVARHDLHTRSTQSIAVPARVDALACTLDGHVLLAQGGGPVRCLVPGNDVIGALSSTEYGAHPGSTYVFGLAATGPLEDVAVVFRLKSDA